MFVFGVKFRSRRQHESGGEAVERDGAWSTIMRELRVAPAAARRALIVSLSGFGAGLVMATWDVVIDTRPDEFIRLSALVLALFGAAALVVAQVLHQVSQGVECRLDLPGFVLSRKVLGLHFPKPASNKFHRALLGVPLLALISVILMAVSLGIILPMSMRRPVIAVVAVVIALYTLYGARFVYLTAEFLFRHAAEQAEAAARAQAQATEAQLSALQAQMNPHFLFNALNTVAALVRTNGREAEETVENLAEVLRRTLDRSRTNLGSVADELDYLKSYLSIEKQRYGQRLKLFWAIDPAALPLSLPPLTLQPLVENALRHGIGARLEGGKLAIEAVRNNGNLLLSVFDDGVGFPARYQEGTGIGNLRQRLQTLYNGAHELKIDSHPGETRITITLPALES